MSKEEADRDAGDRDFKKLTWAVLRKHEEAMGAAGSYEPHNLGAKNQT